jgi:hypothetical protein
MQETFESKLKISPMTIGMGVAATAAILLTFWFLSESFRSGKSVTMKQTVVLKMSPAEQEYAKKIEIGNIAMSRAENFLHQEVTTLSGELLNNGSEPVLRLILTTEFSDDMHQIVLRETRKVLGPPSPALAPGERRAFEISFDHVPNSWNMHSPTVRVAHLQLSADKQ